MEGEEEGEGEGRRKARKRGGEEKKWRKERGEKEITVKREGM